MPVIAVGFAALAIATAVSTFSTFAIIAAVGATIAAVGALTNSKPLMIAGGVIGAIGGIGGLAESAGMFGSGGINGMFSSSGTATGGSAVTDTGTWATSTAGDFSNIDQEIANWSTYSSQGTDILQGAPTITSAAPGGSPSSDVINMSAGQASVDPNLSDPLSNVASASTSPDVTPSGALNSGDVSVAQGGGEGGTLGTTANPADPNVSTTLDPNVAVPNPSPTGGVTGAPANPMDAGIPGSYAAAQRAVSAVGPVKITPDASFFDKISAIISKPGMGTILSGAIQAGGSFLAGATNGLTPAQIKALEAQANANNAAANLTNTQVSNIQSGVPTAWRTGSINNAGPPPPQAPVAQAQVTGSPQGLINNQAGPKLPMQNVTGSPA